jgi:hypothetical protein
MAEFAPLLEEKIEIPQSLSSNIPSSLKFADSIKAMFTSSKQDRNGRRLPQAIAHRGYKAAHPENTMGAFKGAVEVGAHAIETDLHISKDGVVVLSHVRAYTPDWHDFVRLQQCSYMTGRRPQAMFWEGGQDH